MSAAADADERARLVGAAWVVLERAGFEGFKVQLLLRETGLSARSFYRHFADKDALLLTLMQDEYARSGARLRRVLATVDDPGEQVAAWITDLVLAASDAKRAPRARLFTSLPAVLRRFPDEVDAASRFVLDPLAAAIAEGKATGVLPLGDPQRDPPMIHHLAGAAMTHALADETGSTAADVASDVTAFVLRALGHQPP